MATLQSTIQSILYLIGTVYQVVWERCSRACVKGDNCAIELLIAEFACYKQGAATVYPVCSKCVARVYQV